MLLQRLALRAVIACALAAPSLAAPAHARPSTVILICPTTVAPDHCTRDTASDVIVGVSASTPYGCLLGGMTNLARQTEGGLLTDRYALTRCEGRPD